MSLNAYSLSFSVCFASAIISFTLPIANDDTSCIMSVACGDINRYPSVPMQNTIAPADMALDSSIVATGRSQLCISEIIPSIV